MNVDQALSDHIQDLLDSGAISNQTALQLHALADSHALSLSDLGDIDHLSQLITARLNLIETANGDDAPSDDDGRFQDADALSMPEKPFDEIAVLPNSLMENRKMMDMDAIKAEMNNLAADDTLPSTAPQTVPSQGKTMFGISNALTSPFTPDDSEDEEIDTSTFEFRAINGTGNNLTHHDWGQTHTAYLVHSQCQYGDGMNTPNDADRPGVREISNTVFAQSGDMSNAVGLSNYLWVWGQFVDHDITLTKEGHDVRYFIQNEKYKDIGDGMVEKSSDWRKDAEQRDVACCGDIHTHTLMVMTLARSDPDHRSNPTFSHWDP